MYRFTGMLSELGGFSGKLGRYYALLDVILVFMASYALIIFTGVHQICAELADVDIITFSEVGMEIAAPAVCAVLLAIVAMAPIAILLTMFTRRRRDGVCASVGAAYPGLDEPLKTAYDNRGIENVVVDDLAGMVTAEMDEIAYSSFLNRKRITSRVVLIILLALFIVSLAVANFSVVESIDGVKLPVFGEGDGDVGIGGSGDTIEGVGTGGSGDIYGEPSVASIEGTNLDLTMYTGIGSEFSIREVSETGAQEFMESSPFPAEATGSRTYELSASENSALVGRYFEKLPEAE